MRYPKQIIPPVINGEVLMTTEQFSKVGNISIDRIRERTSTRVNRRGGFIPSIKQDGRRWFDSKSLAALNAAKRQNKINSAKPPAHTYQPPNANTQSPMIDMSWL